MVLKFSGYHGTDGKIARDIKDNGFYIKKAGSKFPNDLGEGIYFFIEMSQHDIAPQEMAEKFVKKFKSGYQTKATIKVDLNIPEDRFLDLNDEDAKKLFALYRNKHVGEVVRALKSYPELGALYRGNYDGIILKLLIEDRKINVGAIIKDTYTPDNDFDSKDSKGEEISYRISNFPNGREISIYDLSLIDDKSIKLSYINS